MDNTRSTAKCHHQAELSLETRLYGRAGATCRSPGCANMMCPRCGNRRVNLIFDPPPVATRAPAS